MNENIENMGRCKMRKTLRDYCARAGITLYYHMLDRVSYQFCAGGYVVNGYLGSSMTSSKLLYEMQKQLVFLLKYGSTDSSNIYYNDGSSIKWHKELSVIPPLAEPLHDQYGFEVFTSRSPEEDEKLQFYYDFEKS